MSTEAIGFRSRFSQCVDYMRFNEKSFCFRWQETTKLMLFFNTETSSLVVLCDLRYLTGNISSVMTKHMGVQQKHFPRYWPYVRGIHRWPVNSPHKGQWRGALIFSLICVWISRWESNREAGDLRHHRTNCYVIVMMEANKSHDALDTIVSNRCSARWTLWTGALLYQKNVCHKEVCNTHLRTMPIISQPQMT